SCSHNAQVAYSHRKNSAPKSSGSPENSETVCTSGVAAAAPTTGITPFPSFPELSATSCSTQSASRTTGSGGRSSSLSRPASAAAATARPNRRAASTSTTRAPLRPVHAEQRGRQHPHARQCRIPAADIRRMREHRAEPGALRERLQRTAGIGDGDELSGGGAAREVPIRRERLDGGAGFTRDDEERVLEGDPALDVQHRTGIGA